jgi:hypothetical protein
MKNDLLGPTMAVGVVREEMEIYAIHGTISSQVVISREKSRELTQLEARSNVSVVTLQTYRKRGEKGRTTAGRGSTVFEHPAQLLGLNPWIQPFDMLDLV